MKGKSRNFSQRGDGTALRAWVSVALGVENYGKWCLLSTPVFKSGFHMGSYKNLPLSFHHHEFPVPIE